MEIPSFSLEDKVAIVTGSSVGIGSAVAVGMAKYGAKVAIMARDIAGLSETEERLKSINAEYIKCQLELTDLNSIKKMVSDVINQFNRIDILVNNAGTVIVQPSLEVTEREWNTTVDTNMKGTFFCCQEVAKHMIEAGGGSIINVSSTMGVVGMQERAAYCASKAGVIQLTKALAIEWAPFGIRVNAIAPSFTRSRLTQWLLDDKEKYDAYVSNIPLGRHAEPEEMVGAIIFLASDASSFITGHNILVDGGYCIR